MGTWTIHANYDHVHCTRVGCCPGAVQGIVSHLNQPNGMRTNPGWLVLKSATTFCASTKKEDTSRGRAGRRKILIHRRTKNELIRSRLLQGWPCQIHKLMQVVTGFFPIVKRCAVMGDVL